MKLLTQRSNQSLPKSDLTVFFVTSKEIDSLLKLGTSKKGRSIKAKSGSLESLFAGSALGSHLKAVKFGGKSGQAFRFEAFQFGDLIPSRTIALIGADLSSSNRFDEINNYRKLGMEISNQARTSNAVSVNIITGSISLRRTEMLNAFLEGLVLIGYSFDFYRTPPKEPKYGGITQCTLITADTISQKNVDEAFVVTAGVNFARDLVNLSPRDCTPGTLVKKAREVAKVGKLAIDVLDRNKLEKMKANSLLAVAQGSDEPPYLIKLTYKPARRSSKVIALVGKGVTFDSGGLSLKPGDSMMDMKMDMAGAAAVLGAMQAIAALKPEVEVRAYIPTVENMVNGHATRPGDVVKAMSGKTIEILNTDAEGRLILVDAMHLAEKEGAQVIIDLATLTGAIMVALGPTCAGLFTDDDKLAKTLLDGAEVAGERIWRMPLLTEYRTHLDSLCADIKNIGQRLGGAISAALFLKDFIGKARWAHLDIAGPAYCPGANGVNPPGATGFGVRTLIRAIKNL